MDMDYFEDFIEGKTKRDPCRENHRWTEAETNNFLESILTMLRETNMEFERPSARLFYEKLKSKYFTGCNLTVVVLKSKMRHLKSSYLKAVEWKDNTGMQLYESDQRHVNARIKSICPFYNLLDDIFGPISNSDPIGFRLPTDMPADEKTVFSDHLPKRAKKENTEALIVPKLETFYDEQFDDRDEIFDTNNDDYEDSFEQNSRKRSASTKLKRNNVQTKSNLSLEERQFQLEKQKFQVNYALESRRISLEEKKLRFEKEKFEKTQKLRKYEIDKQFAVKKQEIESNERLKRLELGKRHEIMAAEVEDIPLEQSLPVEELEEEVEEEQEEETQREFVE